MIDYKVLFEQTPLNVMVFEPVAPYRIVAISYMRFKVTGMDESKLVGKTLWEVFPDSDNKWNKEAASNLIDALETVTKLKRRCGQPIIRYDLPREDGNDRTIYWSSDNFPHP